MTIERMKVLRGLTRGGVFAISRELDRFLAGRYDNVAEAGTEGPATVKIYRVDDKLTMKAKLEAAASGVLDFEEEFLSYILLPDGGTVGRQVLPRVADVYLGRGDLLQLPRPADVG